MTRRLLFALPALAPAAVAQTITACAPVFGRFPALCKGQCPACLKANGVMKLEEAIERGELIRPGAKPESLKVLRDCVQCRNSFWQDLSE